MNHSSTVPSWFHVTYRLPGGLALSTDMLTTSDQFWSETTDAYQKDQLIILRGASPEGAFPARQILSVSLRPCQPHEIPEGSS